MQDKSFRFEAEKIRNQALWLAGNLGHTIQTAASRNSCRHTLLSPPESKNRERWPIRQACAEYIYLLLSLAC